MATTITNKCLLTEPKFGCEGGHDVSAIGLSVAVNPMQMTQVKSSSLVRYSCYEVRSCIYMLQRLIIFVISSITEIVFSYHRLNFIFTSVSLC
jgi:hypothetical protein